MYIFVFYIHIYILYTHNNNYKKVTNSRVNSKDQGELEGRKWWVEIRLI